MKLNSEEDIILLTKHLSERPDDIALALDSSPDLADRAYSYAMNLVERAYSGSDREAEQHVHSILWELLSLRFRADKSLLAEQSYQLYRIQTALIKYCIEHESANVLEEAQNAPQKPEEFMTWVDSYCAKHPAGNHPLFQ